MEKSESFFLCFSEFDLLLWHARSLLVLCIAWIRLQSICDALFLVSNKKKRCEWTKLLARLLFLAAMMVMTNDDDGNGDRRQHGPMHASACECGDHR